MDREEEESNRRTRHDPIVGEDLENCLDGKCRRVDSEVAEEVGTACDLALPERRPLDFPSIHLLTTNDRIDALPSILRMLQMTMTGEREFEEVLARK